MPHPLEVQYGLTAEELLDAMNRRFRARVTLEGAVAEVQFEKHIRRLVAQRVIERYEAHDRDGYPDFSIWLPGQPVALRIEVKNVRDTYDAYRLIYQTAWGKMYCADSLPLMEQLPEASVDLVVTSPPYALHFKKAYGNADQQDYVNWFLPYAAAIKRLLKPTGSFVLNVGGAWTPGTPTRSLYHYRLLLALCDELGFKLAQEFFWYNPAKMPAPAEWVNVRRIRVKDSVEYIYWLSTSAFPKADNSNVLQSYTNDMKRLMKRGIRPTTRPSGHAIKQSFSEDRGGSIPPNLIESGNNESNSSYIKLSKLRGQKVHPARFPAELPRFFIKMLTDPGDLVLDPFAGSNTTGAVAESLRRRWIAIEILDEYVENSRLRFAEASLDQQAEPSFVQASLLP